MSELITQKKARETAEYISRDKAWENYFFFFLLEFPAELAKISDNRCLNAGEVAKVKMSYA